MLEQRGLRLLAFVVVAVAACAATNSLVGGFVGPGRDAAVLAGLLSAVELIVLSALWRRFGRDCDARLPRTPRARRVLELAAGFLAGAGLFAGVAWGCGAWVGGAWQLQAAPSVRTLLGGLGVALALMLAEELLFRGYALQEMAARWGRSIALIVSAAAFGAYHVAGSGDWAMGAAFRFAMPALGGLLFGYAALRSGSLALPIGLHWGGNWVQAAVLGLGHEPGTSRALWVMPLDPVQQRVLAAPDLLPHAPYLLALGGAFLLVRFGLERRTASC